MAESLYELDVGSVGEPLVHDRGLVAGSPILNEMANTVLVHAELQLVIKQLPLPYTVNPARRICV
jgi:hypothetical protein